MHLVHCGYQINIIRADEWLQCSMSTSHLTLQLSSSWLLSSRYQQEILHHNVTSAAAGLLENNPIQYNNIVIIILSWKLDRRKGLILTV